MKLAILVLCSLIVVSSSAQNAIYRCKDSTGKTLFSDHVCNSADAVQVSAAVTLEQNTPARSPYVDMATDQIRSALRAQDFEKADRLATTAEQMSMVADAKLQLRAAKEKAASERKVMVCQNYSTGHGYGTSVCR